jgi:hypothetical protein
MNFQRFNVELMRIKHIAHNTHAYVHWRDDPDKPGPAVHLAGFASTFTLSLCDKKRSRKPPNAYSPRLASIQRNLKTDIASNSKL